MSIAACQLEITGLVHYCLETSNDYIGNRDRFSLSFRGNCRPNLQHTCGIILSLVPYSPRVTCRHIAYVIDVSACAEFSGLMRHTSKHLTICSCRKRNDFFNKYSNLINLYLLLLKSKRTRLVAYVVIVLLTSVTCQKRVSVLHGFYVSLLTAVKNTGIYFFLKYIHNYR